MTCLLVWCWFSDVIISAVENEVEERKAFLDKMYQLGRGKEYHSIIETEISQVSQTLVTVTARVLIKM